MSERGSFITEYIYCPKCLEVAKKHLLGNGKFLCSIVMPGWGDTDTLPIIGGKIGGLGAGDEKLDMQLEFIPAIEKEICHKITIAVIPDDGEPEFFVAEPRKQYKQEKAPREGLDSGSIPGLPDGDVV